MKKFLLKSFQVINLTGFVFLIAGIAISKVFIGTEISKLPLLLIVIGSVFILLSHVSLISVIEIATSYQEVEEEMNKLHKKDQELDKLIKFLKNKALESTIVSKKELFDHMDWEDDKTM